MGSGFTPATQNGEKLAAMAAILAETDAYADFVGDTIAGDGVSGMYFFGIDRADLEANDETFPAAFVIWDRGATYRWRSTQSGGDTYRFEGQVVMVLEADTPVEHVRNTPAALNWIVEQCDAMVWEMTPLFGLAGRQEVAGHGIIEGPYREHEKGRHDYLCLVYGFDLRN